MGGPSYLARVQAEIRAVALPVPCSGFRLQALRRTPYQLAERCSSLTTASVSLAPNRLSVVLSMKEEMERETGLEPATFSLEGRGPLAQ
jgi:hypothetical protein